MLSLLGGLLWVLLGEALGSKNTLASEELFLALKIQRVISDLFSVVMQTRAVRPGVWCGEGGRAELPGIWVSTTALHCLSKKAS